MDDDESVRFELFQGRPAAVHLGALVAGVGLVGAVYLAVLLWFSDTGLEAATASGTTALTSRQSAIIFAGVVAGTYYALCTTRVLGGLLLNVLMVPVSATVAPLVVGLALGTLPMITRSPPPGPLFLFELVVLMLPGLLVTFVGLALWGWRAFPDRETSERWARTYLPPRYRESVTRKETASDPDREESDGSADSE